MAPIFLNRDSYLRLIRALAIEWHKDWTNSRLYLNMDLPAERKRKVLSEAL